ncbi:MAG: alpha/beta hydrolase-fold protein [Chloroflexota bacterium]
MIDSEIESSVLPQPLEYKIYIPPCYEELPEHSFPVLYLIHGQTFRQDQWDRLGVDETADSMIGLGESVPFIIVLPRDRIWATPNTDKFGEGVINDLVPYIDRAYRTIPNRQFRSIGGLSRGASWAVHLGLQYWEVFGAIGAHSLPVFWSDVRNVRPWLKAIPPESMPRIYIDIATKDTQDSRESTEWFISVLIEENIQHEWYRFVGTHTEDYWQDHIRQYLQFYTKEW